MYKLSELEAREEFNQIKALLNTKEVLNLEEYERVVGWGSDYEKILYPIGNAEFLNLNLASQEFIEQIYRTNF